MTYKEIKEICRKGKIGLIPNWKGYIKYDYYLNLIYFINGNYRLSEKELEDKLKDRTDLYYII